MNELLARGLTTLEDREDDAGHAEVELAGRPSVIIWRDTGGELQLSVWWDYDHSKHPGGGQESFHGPTPLAKSRHYPKFIGAAASGWVERRTGKWLQGGNGGNPGLFECYTRSADRATLNAFPVPVPNGFKPQGGVC